MAKKKFDESKYEVSEDMPERFAQVIPGMGIQHFSRKHLTDNDMKALINAKSIYVTAKETPEYTEDAPAGTSKKKEAKPEYKDIEGGKFPQ